MSNPDSFIDEVTEELRREKLTRLFRRFGWLGGVAIAAIVAGTAFTQWQAAKDAERAQAFGDALIEALDTGSPEGRREALAAVPATGKQAILLNLIRASDPDEDAAATVAALDALIADASLEPVYRDLAILRRASVAQAEPVDARRASLETISAAGRPYAFLAREQLAWLLIEEGKVEEAIAALNALMVEQGATMALRGRVSQVVTALGGEPAPLTSVFEALGAEALGAN